MCITFDKEGYEVRHLHLHSVSHADMTLVWAMQIGKTGAPIHI